MLADNLCQNEAWQIADRLLPINDDGEPNAYLATDDNYRYEIFDSSGTLRFSTYDGEEALSTVTVPGSNWYPYYDFPEGELWGEEDAALPDTEDTTDEVQPANPILALTPAPIPTPQRIEAETDSDDIYARGRTVNFTVTCYLLRDMKAWDNAMFQTRCFDFGT